MTSASIKAKGRILHSIFEIPDQNQSKPLNQMVPTKGHEGARNMFMYLQPTRNTALYHSIATLLATSALGRTFLHKVSHRMPFTVRWVLLILVPLVRAMEP
jgi:hypothetical protein